MSTGGIEQETSGLASNYLEGAGVPVAGLLPPETDANKLGTIQVGNEIFPVIAEYVSDEGIVTVIFLVGGHEMFATGMLQPSNPG